jgi:hypothetical protein
MTQPIAQTNKVVRREKDYLSKKLEEPILDGLVIVNQERRTKAVIEPTPLSSLMPSCLM